MQNRGEPSVFKQLLGSCTITSIRQRLVQFLSYARSRMVSFSSCRHPERSSSCLHSEQTSPSSRLHSEQSSPSSPRHSEQTSPLHAVILSAAKDPCIFLSLSLILRSTESLGSNPENYRRWPGPGRPRASVRKEKWQFARYVLQHVRYSLTESAVIPIHPQGRQK